MADQTLTDAVRAMALELGADLVGVAPAGRFTGEPEATSPRANLPEVRCVVVCAMRYQAGSDGPTQAPRVAVEGRLESLVFQVARFLEDSGATVLPLPASWPEHLRWQRNAPQTGTVALGHVVAAVAAGLGIAGPDGTLLTPEFGTGQALCSLLTDADLVPSPVYEGPRPQAARPPRCLGSAPELPDRMAAEHLFRLAFDQEMDAVAIVAADGPGVRSVVLYGTRAPVGRATEPVQRVLGDWLAYAGLDLCRHLETLGYQAVPGTADGLPDALRAAGLAADGPVMRRFGCLVTDARLPHETRVHPLRPEQPSDPEQAKLDLMSVLMEEGADLVGVADSRSVDRLAEQWNRAANEAGLQPVRAHLSSARSALVIGYHFPFASLERAGEAPAESVGPYVHATHRTARWLEHMACKALRRLEEMGYQGVVTPDLGGSGSQVASPWGQHPGAMACRFPAAAAGLAWLGLHGAPLHPEYGVTLRFIAVVTDAPLPADRPLREETPCRDCDAPCVEACPVQALDDSAVAELECRGTVSALAAWDGDRCAWARHHALVGAEGPRWFGLETDQQPPQTISATDITVAAGNAGPLHRQGVGILEGCLKACQMEGAWSEAE